MKMIKSFHTYSVSNKCFLFIVSYMFMYIEDSAKVLHIARVANWLSSRSQQRV